MLPQNRMGVCTRAMSQCDDSVHQQFSCLCWSRSVEWSSIDCGGKEVVDPPIATAVRVAALIGLRFASCLSSLFIYVIPHPSHVPPSLEHLCSCHRHPLPLSTVCAATCISISSVASLASCRRLIDCTTGMYARALHAHGRVFIIFDEPLIDLTVNTHPGTCMCTINPS